jgi:hypothetical protein
MDKVTVFDRKLFKNILKSPITHNTIILPDYFIRKINELCNKANETTGRLVCNKSFYGDYIVYTVEHIFVSAEGTPGSVYRGRDVRLGDTNSNTIIEFHTHTVSLHFWWHSRFSSGDIATFQRRETQEGRSYKHVLFTPTHFLTYGEETPEFRIVNNTNPEAIEIIRNKDLEWAEKLK